MLKVTFIKYVHFSCFRYYKWQQNPPMNFEFEVSWFTWSMPIYCEAWQIKDKTFLIYQLVLTETHRWTYGTPNYHFPWGIHSFLLSISYESYFLWPWQNYEKSGIHFGHSFISNITYKFEHSYELNRVKLLRGWRKHRIGYPIGPYSLRCSITYL